MTNLSDTLAALSEAASTAKYWLEHSFRTDLAADQREALETLVALGDAHRTGQLVPVPSVERVAEGLREGLRSASKAPPGLRVKALVATIEQAIAAMQEGRDG